MVQHSRIIFVTITCHQGTIIALFPSLADVIYLLADTHLLIRIMTRLSVRLLIIPVCDCKHVRRMQSLCLAALDEHICYYQINLTELLWHIHHALLRKFVYVFGYITARREVFIRLLTLLY